METQLAPIGFEGLFSDNLQIHIGFEQFENDQRKPTTLVYPAGMPLLHLLIKSSIVQLEGLCVERLSMVAFFQYTNTLSAFECHCN